MNSGIKINVLELTGNIRNKGYSLITPISLKLEVILSPEMLQDLHHIHINDNMILDLIHNTGEESKIAIINHLNKKLRNV